MTGIRLKAMYLCVFVDVFDEGDVFVEVNSKYNAGYMRRQVGSQNRKLKWTNS